MTRAEIKVRVYANAIYCTMVLSIRWYEACATTETKTSGYVGRSSFCGDYRLGPARGDDFRPIPVRDLRGMKRKASGRYVKYIY